MDERGGFQKELRFLQRRRTPSFSSSLLDSIFDSLDDSNARYFHRDRRNHFREPVIPVKQRIPGTDSFPREEKQTRNFNGEVMKTRYFTVVSSSSSSSSDSSTGAPVSSSETESVNRSKSKSRRTGNGVSVNGNSKKHQKLKHCDGGLAKASPKAPKFYGELENVKQPISPGRRITNFLTSIFNSGNVKKAKMCYAGAAEDVSTSSASSLSRSCLHKSSSSSGKLSSANEKRVKFYPINMIIDEESKPSSLKYPAMGKKRQLLKRFLEEEDEEEDDDCSSCSSSDLFEINVGVGIGRYEEELPVYETTNLRTNQAIASGFLL